MTSPNELDPELAAALADDEDEGDPPQATDDDDGFIDPEKQAAVDEVRRELQHPKRRGRPKGSHTRKPPEPIAAPTMASASAPPPIVKRPMDMEGIWENILQQLQDRGMGGPEMITIGINQVTLGATREPPKKLNSIPGEAVGGTRNRTPGEDLQDYLERAIHVPLGTGPAMYRLIFRLRGVSRGGDAIMGRAEVTLPSAVDIRKRWEAVAQLARDKERENDFGPMPRQSYARPWGEQQIPMGAAPQMPPTPAAAAPSGMDPFAAQMFDRLFGMYERERREAARLGQAPPPLPFDPRTMQPIVAQAPDNLEERVTKTVVDTLRALGLVPQPGAPPAAPVAPPLTTPVVATAVTAPMNAAKEFFQQMREFKKMEADMREMFAPEEEPEPDPPPPPPVATVLREDDEDDDRKLTPINEQFARFEGDPIMFGKQAEGETTWQWLARVALGNPKIAGKLLEKGAAMLDQSSFGKLVSAFTQMGGPQAQAARSHPLPQGNPVVEHPQANGAAPGFRPSIG